MKHKQTILLSLLIIICLVYANSAQSSWVGLTNQELIQKSDVILIGDIIGPVEVDKGNPQGIDNHWMTHWKVKVHYYLKGSQESSDFYVVTPGAENKSEQTSLDFRLDEWGKTVILFLRERDGFFEPLSPQGILTLDKIEYIHKPDEPVNGKLVLQEFKLNSENNSELEKFILDDSVVTIPQDVPAKQQVPTQRGSLTLFLGLVVLISLVLGVSTLIFKKFIKEAN